MTLIGPEEINRPAYSLGTFVELQYGEGDIEKILIVPSIEWKIEAFTRNIEFPTGWNSLNTIYIRENTDIVIALRQRNPKIGDTIRINGYTVTIKSAYLFEENSEQEQAPVEILEP